MQERVCLEGSEVFQTTKTCREGRGDRMECVIFSHSLLAPLWNRLGWVFLASLSMWRKLLYTHASWHHTAGHWWRSRPGHLTPSATLLSLLWAKPRPNTAGCVVREGEPWIPMSLLEWLNSPWLGWQLASTVPFTPVNPVKWCIAHLLTLTSVFSRAWGPFLMPYL